MGPNPNRPWDATGRAGRGFFPALAVLLCTSQAPRDPNPTFSTGFGPLAAKLGCWPRVRGGALVKSDFSGRYRAGGNVCFSGLHPRRCPLVSCAPQHLGSAPQHLPQLTTLRGQAAPLPHLADQRGVELWSRAASFPGIRARDPRESICGVVWPNASRVLGAECWSAGREGSEGSPLRGAGPRGAPAPCSGGLILPLAGRLRWLWGDECGIY